MKKMAQKASKETPHTWDLGALFKDESELEKYSKQSIKNAQEFEKTYKGRLGLLSEGEFFSALKAYEELNERLERILTYAFLVFARDTRKGDLYAKYEMQGNEISEKIIFFELEFCDLDSAMQQRLIKDLDGYRFYFKKLIESKPHKLSLSAEKALIATSAVGVGAFCRLFDEHLSALKIGKDKKGEEEILSLLHSPNRCERKAAQKDFTKSLKKSSPLLCYILNMVRKDLSITIKLRSYESKETPRHISNQISQKSVDSMINAVNKNMQIVHRFYEIKSQILGYRLKDYDRYAPILSAGKGAKEKANNINYNEAIKLVENTYREFSGEFGEIVARACEKGWISSHPVPFKRGGAFSHGSTPSTHPYVLLNWTGNRRDIFTIAHEFGHMIHQELSRGVGTLNHDTPLTTAESASVFGEMLLFDYLKSKLGKKELLGVYAGKLEDIFSTLFRQVVMTNFERKIHAKDDELAESNFNKIWLEENQKMFGKSVKLTKNYALWWSYIPHFIHSPFYCYAYSYGQLLTLALFGLYKSGKCKDFVKKYRTFLAAGGSKSPSELVGIFGFDVESAEFWEIGIREVKNMLDEFCALYAESKESKKDKK